MAECNEEGKGIAVKREGTVLTWLNQCAAAKHGARAETHHLLVTLGALSQHAAVRLPVLEGENIPVADHRQQRESRILRLRRLQHGDGDGGGDEQN